MGLAIAKYENSLLGEPIVNIALPPNRNSPISEVLDIQDAHFSTYGIL